MYIKYSQDGAFFISEGVAYARAGQDDQANLAFGTAIGFFQIAKGAYQQALDPPDANYTQIATPQFITWPGLIVSQMGSPRRWLRILQWTLGISQRK
jgi:hypothetical protein